MAGISVGSVSVDIVPDTTNFRRDLNAKLRDLSVPVRLDLNDKAFRAELDAATRNRDVNVRVDDHGSIARTQGRTHALVTTLALLAPAAAPLTAVAIGGAAALTGLGAAGILAFKGIQAEMKTGTPLGVAFSAQVGSLTKELATLEHTAASGVLAGFTETTRALTSQLPTLNRQVDILARSIGSDLTPVTRGLTALFTDLFPTTVGIADGIHRVAVGFEGWATGPGGRAFASYLAQELPVVVATLQSLATTGAHVVQALLPLGGPVLGAIKGISDAIGHLPVGVVQAMFVAFAGYKTIILTAAAIDAVTAATKRLQITQATGGGKGKGAGFAGALGTLGPVGVAAAGLAITKQFVIDPFDASQTHKEVNKLTNDPAAFQAAQQRLAGLQGRAANLPNTAGIGRGAGQGPAFLNNQIKQLKSNLDAATAANKAAGHQADGTAAAVNAEAAAVATLGKKMDDAFAKSAGLKSAQIGVAQAAHDATASLHDNGRTLDLNTQKGRDNRTALLNLATAEHTKIDADIAAGKPQKAITKDIVDGHHQLEVMARRFGLSKDAAKRYADSLLAVPRNVLTTVTVNGIAKSAAQIAALKRQMGTGAFYAGQKGATGGLFSGGEFLRRDSGGPVWGAGSSTSDSIPALLSNGEFVIKAATVKAVGAPYLHKLNDTGMTVAPAGPAVFNLYDADGALIGRMRGEAAQVTDAALRGAARSIAGGRR